MDEWMDEKKGVTLSHKLTERQSSSSPCRYFFERVEAKRPSVPSATTEVHSEVCG